MKTALLSLALALLPALALGAPDPEVVAARQAQLEALRSGDDYYCCADRSGGKWGKYLKGYNI